MVFNRLSDLEKYAHLNIPSSTWIFRQEASNEWMRNDVLSMLNNQIRWFVFRSETSLKVYLKKIIAERYECRKVSITSLAPPVNTKWKFIFLLFQKSSKFNDKTLYHMQDEKEDACWINFILLLRIISLFVRLFIHGLRWKLYGGSFCLLSHQVFSTRDKTM